MGSALRSHGFCSPNEEILIYGFGSTTPEKVITEKGFLSKRSLCFRFNQHLHEDVYLFRGPALIHTYPSWDENASLDISEYESYTILFGFQVFHYGGMDSVKLLLALKSDMEKYEIYKGDLRSKSYPTMSSTLRNIEIDTDYHLDSVQGFYGVGARLPAVRGIQMVTKVILCALFNQSIYQCVKVFFQNVLYGSLSNCFDRVQVLDPGKYVVVFESDAIFYMTPSMATNELKAIEDILMLEMEEERRKKVNNQRKIAEKAASRSEGDSFRGCFRSVQLPTLDDIMASRATYASASAIPSHGTVHVCGYGDLQPTLVCPLTKTPEKNYLCKLFNQPTNQRLFFFKEFILIAVLPADENVCLRFNEAGTHFVAFEAQFGDTFETAEGWLGLLCEMKRFERERGVLRSSAYPLVCNVINEVEKRSRNWADNGPPPAAFYAVGQKLPTIQGPIIVNKLIICMLFGQTIYQNIKVFRNNKYHTTLSNAFQVANTCRTGKYVVIFESDTLYRKSPAAILNALQQMEHEYTTELDEEQRRKRAEKNSRKKAKRKEKKLLQQGLEEAENSSKLDQQVSQPEESQVPVAESGEQLPAPRKKKEKKSKSVEKAPEDDEANESEEDSRESSSIEELSVSVMNRFMSLDFENKNGEGNSSKPAPEGGTDQKTAALTRPVNSGHENKENKENIQETCPQPNENEPDSSEESGIYYDQSLEEVLAESVPFEKPKVYARNKAKSITEEPPKTANWKTQPTQETPVVKPVSPTSSGSYVDEDDTTASSYTQDSGPQSEDEVSSLENLPVKPLKAPSRGATAVVVGIYQKGLIVQTLPPTEAESEYFLLDYCSQPVADSRSLTDVPFDVKVLHVFLKVVSVTNLGTAPIVNANLTQKGKKIEKRVATYALDESTWSCGRFRRGQRASVKVDLKLKNEEEKIVGLIVETDEEDKSDVVRAVGPPSHLSFLAQLDKAKMSDEYSPLGDNTYFHKEQFFSAKYFQGDPFFKRYIMFDTLCLVKNYQLEENFNILVQKMEEQRNEVKEHFPGEKANKILQSLPHSKLPPKGDPVVFDIEQLDTSEEYTIRTGGKELKIQDERKKKKRSKKNKGPPDEMEEYDLDEQYNLFRLYIRDPALCICRFNSYQALKNSQLYTIKTRARLTVDKGELCLMITLNNDQVNQVLHHNKATKNKNSWIEGADLKIFNSILQREKRSRFGPRTKSDADVVIDEIQIQSIEIPLLGKDGQPLERDKKLFKKQARIKLRPAKNSKDIFVILQEFGAEFHKEMSQIGPAARDGASETLATGLLKFRTFYGNQRFFNWWRGYLDPEVPESVDYLNHMAKEMKIPNGREPEKPFKLDESQSTALQHAFHRDGITSVSAPPGSGKTLLSGGLVTKCNKERMDDRMIVTATTNQGVDNAVEKIAELSPGFNISREMSKKGEDGVGQELEKYCLGYQSLKSKQTDPALLEAREAYKEVLNYYKKSTTLKEKLSRLEVLHNMESHVKKTYLRTIIPFCGASTPALLARHAEHYNLVIDGDNGKCRRWHIKHIIMDEASQLPYYTSLALCCSFPYLERITIMGDRMQLGPHCILPNTGSLLSYLCRLSELDRINSLATVKECILWMNYRSHLWIVEEIEQFHYGQKFQSGLKFEARQLAYNLDLPLFKIRSKNTVRPVAFINIGAGEDCQNASERAGVLKLLVKLMEKNAPPAGISILCFHRKQKEELEKCLKPYNFEKVKMRNFVSKLCGVHTIDSFQGRENDIIIICTTKSVGESGYHRGIFKFVSDPRRGLVAVSRAKEAMYIFGQWKYLQRTAFWKNKVALMKREKLLYDENFVEMA